MASTIKVDTIQSTTSNVFFQNSVGTEYARFDSTGVFQLANPSSFAAGTAAAPSITATGDTNTGIFFPAADTIGFSEGGAEVARFDSSGNFGLGVTPSAWASGWKVIQNNGTSFASGSSTYGSMAQNYYYNGTNNIYLATAQASLYVQSAGEHQWFNAPSGTAGTNVTLTQAMTLNTNGVLALQGASTSANGVGITFPATQSASSDANTLDDYEEGTWTPTVFLGATSNSIGTATGTYTKIGNVVFFACRAENVTKSGTGSLTMAGLPFTASSAGNQNRYAQFAVRWTGINSGGVIVALAGIGTTTIEFQNFTTTGGYSGTVTDSGISAAYSVYGVSGFYYTST